MLSGQARFQLGVHARDRRIQVLQVGERLTEQKDVVRLQPTNDRLGERVPLGTEIPVRQLG